MFYKLFGFNKNIMINKTYCIYMHKNKINGKVYIGQTINGSRPKKRWDNGRGYVGCPNFHNAIQKYGWDNFEHTILEEGLSREEANEREIYWINHYNSVKQGYNMSLGGTHNNYSHHAVIQFDKKGKKVKEFDSIKEACMDVSGVGPAISACLAGKTKTAYGFVWIYKKDYSEKKDYSVQYKRITPIYMFNLNENFIREFNSLTEANDFVNPDGDIRTGIKKCCDNLQNQSAGYKWMYKKNSPDKKYNSLYKNKWLKKVCQFSSQGELLNIYESIADAERASGVNNSSITAVCKLTNNETQAGGFRWCYFDDLDSFVATPIKPKGTHMKKEICQIDIDSLKIINTFNSIIEASNKLGVGQTQISACCRGVSKTAGGFAFCYLNNYSNFKFIPPNKNDKKVYHINNTTKEILGEYRSIKDTYVSLRIKEGVVTGRCNNKIVSPMKDGTTFCFVKDYDKVINKNNITIDKRFK